MIVPGQKYCSHGLVQQVKFGFESNAEGYDVCLGCGLPTFESVVKAGGISVAGTANPVLVVTMNDIPGYRIDEVHGDVFGLIVMGRNVFSNLGAGLSAIGGGEVGAYTKLLVESRTQARSRLMEEARDLGANAVIAMRFDTSNFGNAMNEVAAYGTAVTVSRIVPEPHTE